MKTYVIKIQAEGINHEQIITDDEDLQVLLSVLKKIETSATKTIAEIGKTS